MFFLVFIIVLLILASVLLILASIYLLLPTVSLLAYVFKEQSECDGINLKLDLSGTTDSPSRCS